MFTLAFMVSVYVFPAFKVAWGVSSGKPPIDFSSKDNSFDSPIPAKVIQSIESLHHLRQRFVKDVLASVHNLSRNTKIMARDLLTIVEAKLPDQSDVGYRSTIRRLLFHGEFHSATDMFDMVPTCSRVTHGPTTCDELQTHSGFDSATEEPIFVPTFSAHACWDTSDNGFLCASTYSIYKSSLSTTCPGPRLRVDAVMDTHSQSAVMDTHSQSGEDTILIIITVAILLGSLFSAVRRWLVARRTRLQANQQGEQYPQLTMGQNVTVSTVKHFVHLFNGSESDFRVDIEVKRLRKVVVEAIREHQQLGTRGNDLDVKIALVVENVKSFEELVKARGWCFDNALHPSRATVLAAHGGPFARSNTLHMATKRTLEFYQLLFYLLQTRGEYLARLFFRMSRVELATTANDTVEQVTLALFSYGQRREEYLMLKFFQNWALGAVRWAPTIVIVVGSHPIFLSIVQPYVWLKQVALDPPIPGACPNAPDTCDMVPNTIGAPAGQSLTEGANVLTLIASSYSDGDGVSAPFQTQPPPQTTITESREDEGENRSPNTADLQDSDPDELYIPRDYAKMEGEEEASSLTDSEEDSPVTLNASSMLEDADESDTPHSHYFVSDSSPEKMDIELPFLDEAETPPTAVNPCKEVDIARGSGEQHSQHLITVQDDLLLTMSSRVKSSSEDMVQQGDIQSIVTQAYNDGEHNNFDSSMTAHRTQPDARMQEHAVVAQSVPEPLREDENVLAAPDTPAAHPRAPRCAEERGGQSVRRGAFDGEQAIDTVMQARRPAAQALPRPVVRVEPPSIGSTGSRAPSAQPQPTKSFAEQIRERQRQTRRGIENRSASNSVPVCWYYMWEGRCTCGDQGCRKVPRSSLQSRAFVPEFTEDTRLSHTQQAKDIRSGRHGSRHVNKPEPMVASPSNGASGSRRTFKVDLSAVKATVRRNQELNAPTPIQPSPEVGRVRDAPAPTPAAQGDGDSSEPQGSGGQSRQSGRRGGRGGRR
ncbi:hypothetical protein CALVIDRAFT_258829 [Calocera viscosa TUFC12733]|uniref:Uncharacterized protein n=1 Tax=Calocera viscosa (strain TUFC12733) TaxID=1330018 RepID=A0A167J2L3_CALVF|nr:hypothetical protein CALVIDRAFT_258829 [Calocera viscosa TUFC12733]